MCLKRGHAPHWRVWAPRPAFKRFCPWTAHAYPPLNKRHLLTHDTIYTTWLLRQGITLQSNSLLRQKRVRYIPFQQNSRILKAKLLVRLHKEQEPRNIQPMEFSLSAEEARWVSATFFLNLKHVSHKNFSSTHSKILPRRSKLNSPVWLSWVTDADKKLLHKYFFICFLKEA